MVRHRVLLAATAGAVAIAAHTAVNLRHLRRPTAPARPVADSVAILIPARDEEDHLAITLRSALAQRDVPHLQVLVLDDGSQDGTGAIAESIATSDARVTVLRGHDEQPPAGWLGKPWACARLADHTSAEILCFVDADVVLEPDAIASLATLLRDHDFALVAPYPRQLSGGWLERLVQPLVTWSWAATMPLRWAEVSTRPSLSAANGQVMVLDAGAYRAIGGHGAVRSEVLEDIALMRALKRSGRHTVTVDGSQVAHCRMYDGSEAVVDGYAKSLWAAFNGPVGSLAANVGLDAVFVLPAIAVVVGPDRRSRLIGLAGYAAGVASRAMVARRTGEPVLPDCLAHPASIAAFSTLNAVSWWRHVRGTNAWKGRAVTVGSTP